jgi:hypothetical protein
MSANNNKDVPMMLEYNAHLNYLVFNNENANLVTALPYIDEKIEDVDVKYRERVTDLIRNEMRQMGAPRDYLEKLPLPNLTHIVSIFHLFILSKKESELIKSEMERVANGERLEAID